MVAGMPGPVLDRPLGLDLDIIATFLQTATFHVIRLLLMLTGNA
jgi:hypothetical protein